MNKKKIISLFLTAMFAFGMTQTGIAQDKITKSFQVKKGDNLTTKVTGDVKVESWGKEELYIEVTGLNLVDRDDLKMNQEGNTVSIILKNKHNVSFSIKTPEQFNLDIKTSGGDLSCLGKFYGNVKGTTAGGDIKVESINGNVELTTAGGNIITGNINGDVKISTAGGDIHVGIVNGEGKMNTAGGDIIVTSSSKSLNVNTAGGDIKVGNVGGEIKASTSGGDIEVGLVSGIAKLNTSGGDIKLAGARGNSSVNTSGGDIKLENIYGSVKANTSGGRVYVELSPDGSEESRLASSGGNITLFIPENAKATIEAVIKADNLKGPYIITSAYKIDNYVTDEDSKEIRATVTFNGGGKLIKLNTSNSKIEIKKLNK